MRLAAARSSSTARSTRQRPPENSTNAWVNVTHVPQARGSPTAAQAVAARRLKAAAPRIPGSGLRDPGSDLGGWDLGFEIWVLTRALAISPRTSNPARIYSVKS